MYFKENFSLAISSLVANKTRAVLTMLGIIIGIAAVIGITTIGTALTETVKSSLSGVGSDSMFAAVQERDTESSQPNGNEAQNIRPDDRITDEMITEVMARYPDEILSYAVSQSVGLGKVEDGRKSANVTVLGVNAGYKDSNTIDLISGRGIKPSDEKAKRNVAIISDDVANKMFAKNVDPLGEEIKVYTSNKIYTYTIIGVYEAPSSSSRFGSSSSTNKRTDIYIPITLAYDQMAVPVDGYITVTFKAAKDVNPGTFRFEIEKFMNRFYKNNVTFQINTFSTEEILKILDTIVGSLSLAIAVIAGISLVVGGIGVMNIMLVSVTERTKDIGTRKALGARKSYIRVQFTMEAVIICLIGGVLGVILGLMIGFAGSYVIGYPSLPSILSVVISVTFSMLIGVFFGLYPANKAASLDPIEALRYE